MRKKKKLKRNAIQTLEAQTKRLSQLIFYWCFFFYLEIHLFLVKKFDKRLIIKFFFVTCVKLQKQSIDLIIKQKLSDIKKFDSRIYLYIVSIVLFTY